MEDKLAVLSARVDELETRLAFQEDTLAQLNDVIAGQDANLRALVTALRELGDKYRDLSFEAQGGNKGGQEKPPHY
ncbi:SlyX family protein [Microbulbifer marinus]|uniref:SlyX protein n=1 Tax=Microbulbifer marinus TaxID=658218 RepID=A0A1H3WAD1_9GAMM|nr:SlyX family protein [Microbulbifer marinus]SDZ84079.1 SlyX protein [Microbulbifer marinus]